MNEGIILVWKTSREIIQGR